MTPFSRLTAQRKLIATHKSKLFDVRQGEASERKSHHFTEQILKFQTHFSISCKLWKKKCALYRQRGWRFMRDSAPTFSMANEMKCIEFATVLNSLLKCVCVRCMFCNAYGTFYPFKYIAAIHKYNTLPMAPYQSYIMFVRCNKKKLNRITPKKKQQANNEKEEKNDPASRS